MYNYFRRFDTGYLLLDTGQNFFFGNAVSSIQYQASSPRNSGYNHKLFYQLNAIRPDPDYSAQLIWNLG